MNYIGSKKTLIPFLKETILKIISPDSHVFCDLFAGTGTVGSCFKREGFKVISNDLQYYSFVLNRNYVGNHKALEFNGLTAEIEQAAKNVSNDQMRLFGDKSKKEYVIEYLNNLKGEEGFVYSNYTLSGTRGQQFERNYYSEDNAKKCDAVRMKIEEWKEEKRITEDEYFFLLASLLEAIDSVANTASVYGAFLKKLKNSAARAMKIVPADFSITDEEHCVYNKDANELIREISCDILYLDPPYNERQYSANYHILETIAKYDDPVIKGKTGLRDYKDQKSKYCSKADVKRAFEELIQNAKAKYIFLSYNNEGLLSIDDVKEIFSRKGTYGTATQAYNRFKADSSRKYSADKTVEYLHYCICK